MKRKDLQDLAGLRLKEARCLIEKDCPEGAYYLAGYAAELALKACIARKTERHDFPDRQRVVASYTHRLADLLRVAGLKEQLEEAASKDAQLRANWANVLEWSEESRYEKLSMADATNLLSALLDRKHGVYRLLRQYW